MFNVHIDFMMCILKFLIDLCFSFFLRTCRIFIKKYIRNVDQFLKVIYDVDSYLNNFITLNFFVPFFQLFEQIFIDLIFS